MSNTETANALVILAAIDGALTVVEKLAPIVQEFAKQGQVTVAQQAALLKRMAELDRLELFSGPEWRTQP